ncbi:DUF3592 domain-containing protein [Streptomyces sp. NPDC052023]|uniref:DUF3592 domain-containing protein n=1 Tax=Streptomyces sp. NPDC052023 TaxID=3365681 RepID=UPI0037D52CDA
MSALMGIGLLLLPFGLRIAYVDWSMKRNAVRVTATCVDHIYEGYAANPRRLVCAYVAPDGREMRWVVPAAPDFPAVGAPVSVAYDRRNEGAAVRRVERNWWISLGVGWTLLAVTLVTVGALGEFAF